MSKAAKTIFLAAVKLLLPLLIIAWLLMRIEPEQWQALQQRPKHLRLLGAALVAALMAMVLSFWRWWMLVRCQGISLGLVEAFRLSAIGLLLSFVSAGSVGGDLFKMIFLARRCPGKGVEAVASVVLDRGIGLLALLLLVSIVVASAGLRTHPDLAPVGQVVILLSGSGLLILIALLVGGRRIDQVVLKLSRLPRLGPLLSRLVGTLRAFGDHKSAIAAALLISLAVHLLLSLAVFGIARGLYGPLAPGLGDHLLIFPIANVATALPIAPAGLGVLELAMEWLYRVVPREPTVASGTVVALAFELVKVIMASVGMVFYWTAGRDIRGSLRAMRDHCG